MCVCVTVWIYFLRWWKKTYERERKKKREKKKKRKRNREEEKEREKKQREREREKRKKRKRKRGEKRRRIWNGRVNTATNCQFAAACSYALAVFFAFCMVQFTSGSKKMFGACLMAESIQRIPLGICPFFHFWPILPFHKLLPGFKNDGMHSFFAVILASHLEKLFACIFLPNCPRMFWLLVVHDCKIANRSTRASSCHIRAGSWPFQTWASDSDCSRPFLHCRFGLLENIQQGIGHFSADSFLWARKGSYCKAIVPWKHVALLDVSWRKKSDHAEAGIVKVLLVLWLLLAAANGLCRFSHRFNVCSWGSIIELTQKFSGTGSNLCSIQHRCARHRKANAWSRRSRRRWRRHLVWQVSKLSHKPLNCRA